jgi:hypothetical protein
MSSKHFKHGGITDSWEQGTPAQRPKGAIAFGGDNGGSNPRVTMRRGEGAMRFGSQTGHFQKLASRKETDKGTREEHGRGNLSRILGKGP